MDLSPTASKVGSIAGILLGTALLALSNHLTPDIGGWYLRTGFSIAYFLLLYLAFGVAFRAIDLRVSRTGRLLAAFGRASLTVGTATINRDQGGVA